MPTILREKGYRFFFYSNEHLPIHIHIEKENKIAKFDLENLAFVYSRGYNAGELKEIRKLVITRIVYFKEKWNEYFND